MQRFTMIGAEAGEVMAVVQAAMLGGLPYTRLREAIIAHPAMAEGPGSLFSKVPPPAIAAPGGLLVNDRVNGMPMRNAAP